MPLPNPFRRLKAETSTVDDLSTALGRQDLIRAEAQAALHDLGAKRPALLLDGSDAELAAHDALMATARRTLEQAEARIEALTPEWQEADRRETAARLDRERRERHAAAVKARAEGVRIVGGYTSAATALATQLRRLAEIERQIEAANADLPEGASPIAGAEPNNGRERVADRWPEHDVWVDSNGHHRGVAELGQTPPGHGYTRKTVYAYTSIPGTPGFPHRPLSTRVALPAVDPNGTPFWAPGAVAPPLSAEARAFLLQRGVSA